MTNTLRRAACVLAMVVSGGSCSDGATDRAEELARSDFLYEELFGEEISSDEELFEEARQLWGRLAEEGITSAQYYLSSLYWMGLAGIEQDSTEYLRLVSMAAGGGYAPAQFALGAAYENGTVVDRDAAKAVEWYVKAADQDYWVAKSRLSRAYMNGELGLPVDQSRADQLWD